MRLKLPSDGILQDLLETPLGLSGKNRHAEIHDLANVRVAIRQHRQCSRNMEAADSDLDAPASKLSSDINRSWKLVGLYADQHHHAGFGGLDRARQSFDPHLPVGFVDRFNVDVEFSAENPALAAIERDAMKTRQRIGRQASPPPSDHIAITVVMRRLDENKPECLVRSHARRVSCGRSIANLVLIASCDDRNIRSIVRALDHTRMERSG
ncbi:hypothetical protein AB7M17_007378 [Bradyrhizobium sp. USDA 377]